MSGVIYLIIIVDVIVLIHFSTVCLLLLNFTPTCFKIGVFFSHPPHFFTHHSLFDKENKHKRWSRSLTLLVGRQPQLWLQILIFCIIRAPLPLWLVLWTTDVVAETNCCRPTQTFNY